METASRETFDKQLKPNTRQKLTSLRYFRSNGPIWARILAEEKNLELHDYAVGGATADNTLITGILVSQQSFLTSMGGSSKTDISLHPFTQNASTPIVVPSVSDQIAGHLSANEPKKTDIYTIWIGSNDAFLSAGDSVSASQVLRKIDTHITSLYVRGKFNFG